MHSLELLITHFYQHWQNSQNTTREQVYQWLYEDTLATKELGSTYDILLEDINHKIDYYRKHNFHESQIKILERAKKRIEEIIARRCTCTDFRADEICGEGHRLRTYWIEVDRLINVRVEYKFLSASTKQIIRDERANWCDGYTRHVRMGNPDGCPF